MNDAAPDEDGPVWRALDLPLERLDELPFGAIVIEPDGTIVGYNEYETRLSHFEREAVIGKHFFRDVAPCTAVQAFEGRLRTFLKTGDRVSEKFDYFFPFPHGAITVEITFLRLRKQGQILIAVERTGPGIVEGGA
ncbi:MAG: PAS domain-containing protein [Candidatus Eremiobacteraeota bacterium]|nr:PAS domain-containing protein [Candidatus Eremiobacteraeota bacterium]